MKKYMCLLACTVATVWGIEGNSQEGSVAKKPSCTKSDECSQEQRGVVCKGLLDAEHEKYALESWQKDLKDWREHFASCVNDPHKTISEIAREMANYFINIIQCEKQLENMGFSIPSNEKFGLNQVSTVLRVFDQAIDQILAQETMTQEKKLYQVCDLFCEAEKFKHASGSWFPFLKFDSVSARKILSKLDGDRLATEALLTKMRQGQKKASYDLEISYRDATSKMFDVYEALIQMPSGFFNAASTYLEYWKLYKTVEKMLPRERARDSRGYSVHQDLVRLFDDVVKKRYDNEMEAASQDEKIILEQLWADFNKEKLSEGCTIE